MKAYEIMNANRPVFRLIVGFGLIALLVFGISSCNYSELGEILTFSEPTTSPGEDPIQAATPAPSATPNTPVLQSKTLIIWVPPQFDPGSESPAGEQFSSRLDEFKSRRPQTEVQIRIKPESGEYGILESLRLVSDAAPIIKPDLIALPRSLAEAAYREGFVLPLDEFAAELLNEELYGYAQNMARIDDQLIGLPFAGDLMVLAYKNDIDQEPPPDWNAVLSSGKPLAFSASDPRGLVTLAHYQSLIDEIAESGAPISFQEEALLEVFTYYQSAQTANVMPYWLTQFETDLQAWQSYLDRQATMVITWSSLVLNSQTANTSLAPLPTSAAKPFAYADGWVWCVLQSDRETELEAIDLAGFLTEKDYLNSWSSSSGYLPVYSSGLDSWAEDASYPVLQKLLPTAILIPGSDELAEIGPPLREAVVGVLKDQQAPEAMVSALMEKIAIP